MPRLPKSLALLTLSCALALPAALCTRAWAQDNTNSDIGAPLSPPGAGEMGAPVPAPAPADATDAEHKLRNDVDAYFHYAWIGRYDLASQFADAIADEDNDPGLFLHVLEQTAVRHDPNMGYMAQLLLFDAQPAAKAATDKLLIKVQQANVVLLQDPNFIAKTIRDMSVNERAYQDHLPLLRHSGEMAVPVLLEFLQLNDDQHLPYRATARRALVDMGEVAVNPLLAALDSNDQALLLTVIDSLRDLGNDVAAPYLARVASNANLSQSVRDAANEALSHLGVDPASANAGEMFYQLAQRFYNGKATFAQIIAEPGETADKPHDVSFYWTYDQNSGLARQEVPSAIFNDLMTMRCCVSAIALNGSVSDAISLWIDADNRREADLPRGEVDEVDAGQPSANFFSVSVGVNHLSDALRRALADGNSAVALKLTRSLGEIVGPSMVSDDPNNPLIQALHYPNKLVRFEAAFALAEGLPTKAFDSQQLVVPLLVQAIAQGGKGDVLVLAATQDDLNSVCATLRSQGYEAAGGTTPGETADALSQLPSVDVLLIDQSISAEDAVKMLDVAAHNPQLASAVRVVMEEQQNGALVAESVTDPTLTVTSQTTGSGLRDAIEAARVRAGSPALADEQALDYSLRATRALQELAVNHNAILDVMGAEPGLLAAINDPRSQVMIGAANVLAAIPTHEAQQGLLGRALDPKLPRAEKVVFFHLLAANARTYGNKLDAASIAELQSAIAAEKDNDVMTAAAEARGALSPTTDMAAHLILSQASR